MPKIYCAGPLFNPKEKEEMQEIATALEKVGFETFLPQRDGLELNVLIHELLREGLDSGAANSILSRAIFALDVYQVVKGCDGIFVNLNGRVPDEGAVSEAAIAWSTGKPMVGYKDDMRSIFLSGDNPLVSGLFCFDIHDEIHNAVKSLQSKMLNINSTEIPHVSISDRLLASLSLGKDIWNFIQTKESINQITSLLKKSA